MKFSLVGCGRIVRKHIEAIKELKNAELVGLCDPISERLEAAAKLAGSEIPTFNNYDDMLSTVQTDVVSVLTPSGMHAEHTIDIAKKYKKHIVVEKPMALDLGDADEMIRVCDANGVRLFVVKQNRYNLPVQELRKAIDQESFGKLVMGTVRVRWCRPQAYYDQDAWRGTWAQDGGVFTNQASHHVDLLEWMLGEPVSVMAKTATQLSDIEVEDTGLAIIKFRNGALGLVEATTATRPKDLEGSISILGEKGTVVIGGFAVNKMEIWNFEGVTEEDSKRSSQKYTRRLLTFMGTDIAGILRT
jgi:UDP-N-acetyl-2-amino-2-deoxyglucuronate dehydrogenase